MNDIHRKEGLWIHLAFQFGFHVKSVEMRKEMEFGRRCRSRFPLRWRQKKKSTLGSKMFRWRSGNVHVCFLNVWMRSMILEWLLSVSLSPQIRRLRAFCFLFSPFSGWVRMVISRYQIICYFVQF